MENISETTPRGTWACPRATMGSITASTTPLIASRVCLGVLRVRVKVTWPRLPPEDAFLAPCHSTSLLQVHFEDVTGHQRADAACSLLTSQLNSHGPFQQRCDLFAIQVLPRQVEVLVADRPNAGTRSTEEQSPGDTPARVLVPGAVDSISLYQMHFR